jgi:hypothetical protein
MHEQTPDPELVTQRLAETYPGNSLAEPLTKAVLLAALATVSSAKDSRRPLLERMQPGGGLGARKLVPGQQQGAVLSWVDDAYRLMLDYTADRIGFNVQHITVGPQAEAEMGFITRTDIRRSNAFFRYTFQ